MERKTGIGLDVIERLGGKPSLFKFKWYDPYTKTQKLICYTDLWHTYFDNVKVMYVPFYYEGVYQSISISTFKI